MRILMPIMLVFLLTFPNISHAEYMDTNYEESSELLFPETSGWTLVSSMQKADAAFLLLNKAKLKKAYIESEVSEYRESQACSFIDQIMAYQDGFYLNDIDTDGYMDVIYTGLLYCGEGPATVIWFGEDEGYTVKQGSFWDVIALRVKNGEQVIISSVKIGCCDSETDEFCLGPIKNIYNHGRLTVTKTTQFPQRTEGQRHFIANNELVLRSSPANVDDYDLKASGLSNNAVFGNILSKYLPGCSGNIAGDANDNNGNLWYYVVLDKECGPLRFHAPYEIDAGWVDAASIKIDNE